MKRIKSSWPVLGVLFVLFAVINIVAFVLVNDFTANFWSGYVFITIAWISLLFTTLITIKTHNHERAFFLAAPQILICLVYALLQMIAGIAIIAIPKFNLPASIAIQTILFALFLIIELGLSVYKKRAVVKPETRQNSVTFKKTMLVDLTNAISRCKSQPLKQKLNEIEELLTYSDPVSSEETIEYENRISELFSQVKNSLYQQESYPATLLCNEIAILIKQRNEICAASKKH